MKPATNRDVLFLNGTLILPDRVIADGMVLARDGRIEWFGKARSRLPAGVERIDARGGFIAPGFVDIHVHGGGGADFMDGSPEAVRTAARCHLRHGTTTLLPTTTTGSPAQITAMFDAVRIVRKTWTPADGARIGGIHLYGPFFAPEKVGCHRADASRAPDATEYRRYFAGGLVRVATCAAELPGAAGYYRTARKHGCLITCGHSNASWAEMGRGYENGMRHVDHFWCVMSSVDSLRSRFGTPMQAGMEQFVLAQPEMSTEVIADGCHLSAELLEFAWRMKGPDRLCLVTDSSRALDMPPGRYRFGPSDDGTWFEHDGQVGRMPNGNLASSAAGMDRMVQTMARQTSAPLHEVVRMASLTPAVRVGLAEDRGSLESGKLADILLLDPRLKVKAVFLAGQQVGRRRAPQPSVTNS